MASDFREIPVVDLEPWFSGGRSARQAVAHNVRRCCEEVGFLYIGNHGVPTGLVERTFVQAREFFSLSDDQKNEVSFERANRNRGYIPLAAESTDPKAGGDLKEAYDFTYPAPPNSDDPDITDRMYGNNLWTSFLPGFRPVIEVYFLEMVSLGRELMSIFASSLRMPAGFFDDKTDRPIAQLRLLHYPPRRKPLKEGRLGIGTHCDYEALTILAQDAVGGLQVQNGAGTWIDAPYRRDTFVINVGEMMTRFTNGRFRATPHRVVNPSGQERYSVPFFFGPNYDTEIAPFGTCVDETRPAKYEPVAAGRYLIDRLSEIYGR